MWRQLRIWETIPKERVRESIYLSTPFLLTRIEIVGFIQGLSGLESCVDRAGITNWLAQIRGTFGVLGI